MINFNATFAALTDHPPFPWQCALYDDWFSQGKFPASCNLPTGLGKTSVIAVWLIALANGAAVPRRLVYVVNRRTVVDQTTTEVEYYRNAIKEKPELAKLKEFLNGPLALSTLRGQFADNREWSADPSRPAVICGTVDMIGSRLLFSGYGVGFKGKPLHAGFLGQDALLVHDEAHLEPAFQDLLVAIEREQARCKDFRPLRMMELSATSRGGGEVFALTDADRRHPVVSERVNAVKTVHLHEASDAKKLVEQLVGKAQSFKDSGRSVLVFVRTVEDVRTVSEKLPKDRVVTLTGTMRGKERDDLVEHPIFQRFLPGGQSDAEAVYLVCTSAGEVGVNISADHLVCDLSTFESMAQRFGRVNRFGKRTDTQIHIVCPSKFEDKDEQYRAARDRTLALLRQLNGDGSPDALGKLDPSERIAAFAPPPTILPVTDILFDAWALTTIKDKLPGRPPVEPYLHGLPTDRQPPETQVAWREEVGEIIGKLREEHKPAALIDAYPLKPHELLKEPSYRALKHFEAMAKRLAKKLVPVWLMDDDGSVEPLTLSELADKDNKGRIEGKTVLLPPSAGGLAGGMLDGDSADRVEDVSETADRRRTWDDDPDPGQMGCIYEIDTRPEEEGDTTGTRFWYWWEAPKEGGKANKLPVLWCVHVCDVERRAKEIMAGFSLGEGIHKAVELAARFHDHGKRRRTFQRVLGNWWSPKVWWAKSGGKGTRLKESYRHEFGSLLDVLNEPDFKALADRPEVQDLILHLIASHHGFARPHFPCDLAFDPEPPPGMSAEEMARTVPRRFSQLQRRYGRWGLAYLESLLRAADWAASAAPSQFVTEDES